MAHVNTTVHNDPDVNGRWVAVVGRVPPSGDDRGGRGGERLQPYIQRLVTWWIERLLEKYWLVNLRLVCVGPLPPPHTHTLKQFSIVDVSLLTTTRTAYIFMT